MKQQQDSNKPRQIKPKRNWKKLMNMGSLGALGFIMLFQYQNCAPATGVRSMASDSSIVNTIDDVNLTTGVQFASPKLELAMNNEPTLIEGACDSKQNGAVLGWKVHDANGEEKQRGYSVCEQGRFEVEMAPSSELECDQPYGVTARLNTGTSAQTEVHRACTGEEIQKAQASN